MTRCAYRHCGQEIGQDRREGTRFCDSRCRVKEWKLRRGVSGTRQVGGVTLRTDTGRVSVDSVDSPGPAETRRESRDGKGVHVYLTKRDLDNPLKLARKLRAAQERIG